MSWNKSQKFYYFESRNKTGGFIKITFDMIRSKAYRALTAKQRDLYFWMKYELDFKATGRNGAYECTNADGFVFPQATWKGLKLYADFNAFKRDYEALIEKGFIKLVSTGKNVRKPNVYAMSNAWITWGSEEKKQKSKSQNTNTKSKSATLASSDDGGGNDDVRGNDSTAENAG